MNRLLSTATETRCCPACGMDSPRSWRRIRGYSLCTCEACGQGYLAERARAQEPSYDPQCYYEDRGMLAQGGGAAEKLALLSTFVSRGRLLEIGCGPGQFLCAARASGWEVEGVETSRWAVQESQRKGLAVYAGGVEDYPGPTRPLDSVCLWDALEHLERPGRELERIRAWLRPGGHVVVRVPNAASLDARIQGQDWPHWDLPFHVSHFTPRTLDALLKRAGFLPVACRFKFSSVLGALLESLRGGRRPRPEGETAGPSGPAACRRGWRDRVAPLFPGRSLTMIAKTEDLP